MCQCGCSEGGPDYRFHGPEGFWYGIRVYTGCQECSTPAGVDIFKMDDSDYRMMNCKVLPLLGFKHGMESFAVIDAPQLMVALKNQGIDTDEDAYSECNYRGIIEEASAATKTYFEAEKEKNAKKLGKRQVPHD